MKSKTHLVIPDPHAHYKHDNKRAEWLGSLICDVRPDVVINLGDTWDMPSLSGYDKGKSAVGRTYRADIDSGIDFNVRLWDTVKKAKKKLPKRIFCMGNHEERIGRAINQQPELEGTLSYDDLGLNNYYDEVVHYVGSTPGVVQQDGIQYAHFFTSGVMGRSIGGEHPAYSLLSKEHGSSTQGHSHTMDYCRRPAFGGGSINALFAGCFFSYPSSWAGTAQRYYWPGVIIKRNVDDGHYDPQFISLSSLEKEYGGKK